MIDGHDSGVPKLVRVADGRTVTLDERLMTIGASSKCRIVVSAAGMPAHCAHIVFSSGVWTVAAVSDKAVVALNGRRLEGPGMLTPGDVLTFGDEEWRYESAHASPAVSAADATPLRRFIGALSRFSRSADVDARFELLAAVAQLLHADGARLVVEETTGDFSTIARYPQSSGLDRFSSRAILWVREKRSTVLMHETDWADDADSKGSLELNRIGSVLCAPLYEGDAVRGYLYVDRCSDRDSFAEHERAVLDDVAPVFGDLLALYEQAQRQRETIAALQKGIERQEVPVIFECDAMRAVIEKAAKFGMTDSTVLITGETGTGKELFARLIHHRSNRAAKEFCAVNCGALPETLIESELFGHEKGAFTGAHQRKKGLFERAQGGTVFLDEIGEIPLNLQVKLLRALQESEVLPLGATAPVKVDVRIVAATNRSLADEVREGRFREDLYYRLNVLEIAVPPLRSRNRDVLLLANYFIRKYAARFGIPEKGIALPAQAKLLAYPWPGNIRQLENIVQKALLASAGALLLESDFELPAEGALSAHGAAAVEQGVLSTLRDARDAAEKQCIHDALRRSNGNVSVAARLLDTDRKWLTKLMRQYGIRSGAESD